ncbi:MAG TPA: hypothetical protein VFZ78_04860 [Flavisolibacter sp.]
MKRIFIIAAVALFSNFSYADEPTPKVLDAFNRTFKFVKEVSWDEYNNQYEAKFSQNDIRLSVVYDEDGNVVRTIRYYFEESLPILIRSRVAKKFEGKKIYGVTELSSQDDLSYTIVLQDETHWYNVRSDAYGNMTIEKKMKKA